MSYLYTSIVFFVGFMLPAQVCINAKLARFINSPLHAALISFGVGSVCFEASVLIFKIPFPMITSVTAMPD
jgi:bacterial/archaeal transporter family-2 protein